MKKILLFLLIGACFSATAQNSSDEVDIEFYGSSEINSNSLNYNTLNKIIRGGKFTEQDKEKWGDYIQRKNVVRTEGAAGIKVLWTLSKEKKHKIGFNCVNDFSGGIKFSDALWRTILYGNSDLSDEFQDIGGLNYNAAGYSTLQVAYQSPKFKLNAQEDYFFLNFMAGPRFGHRMIYFSANDVRFGVTELAQTLYLSGEYNFHNADKNAINGYGAGWDVALHFGGQRSFGSWELDLFTRGFGFIVWNHNTYHLQDHLHLAFEGFEINNLFHREENSFQNQLDSLQHNITKKAEYQNFAQWQSSSIHLKASLCFEISTTLQAGFSTEISTTFFPKGFHKIEFTPFIKGDRESDQLHYSIGLPISFNSIAGFCLGAKFEVGNRTLYGGAEVASIGIKTLSGYANLFLGIRIR